MFDIHDFPSVITHLKSISFVYSERSGEINLLCPYCNDATRKARSSIKHGHLNINMSYPVFYCFRCTASGTLTKLLLDTGFEDKEIISQLNSFTKFKFSKDYYSKKNIKDVDFSVKLKKKILEENLNFYKNNYNEYMIYYNYLISRLGNVFIDNFLLSPVFLNNNLAVRFINSEGEIITNRFINNNSKLRYLIPKITSGEYYWQEKDFSKYKNIVMTEGSFDALSAFLYCPNFSPSNTFYIGMNGKKYISTMLHFIYEYLLIGKYEINFIFDKDVANAKNILSKGKYIANNYNTNIKVKGWKSVDITQEMKDVTDFSLLTQL